MKNLKLFIEAELLKYLKPKQAERATASIYDRMINEFRSEITKKIALMTKEEMKNVLASDDTNNSSSLIIP